MATHSHGESSGSQQAREALQALESDRGKLAERIFVPGWYHPAVATLTAAAATAPALPSPWALIVPAVFVILIGALPVFTRGSGVAMSVRPTGRATRTLLALQVATLVIGMVASSAIRILELPWWLVPFIAALVFFSILGLGKRYDRAQYAEMSHREAHR